MADVWLPGAYRNPGLNADYRLGRSSMDQAFAHATVGHDSRLRGEDGYFNLLVHQDSWRENGCTQYAQMDSITWHAFEPHRLRGGGVEFERYVTGGINAEGLSNFEDLTPNQIEWGKRIIDWCAELGITPILYNGPRYETVNWRGWVNHHDVDDSRSDGLTGVEWNLLVAGSSVTEPEQEGGLMWAVYYGNVDKTVTFIHGIGAVVAFRLIGKPVEPFGLPMAELNYIGFNFGGITTKMVSPAIGDNLEKASAKLLA